MPYGNLIYISLQILNSIFAVFIVFSQRKNPAVSWAWLMVVALIPVVGFIIYMLVGQDGKKHRVFVEKSRDDEILLDAYVNRSAKGWPAQDTKPPALPDTPHLNDLVSLNYYAGGGTFTSDNRLILYHDGRAKFDALLTDIAEAKEFIFMQYYILRDDDTGRHIVRQLTKKALDGVEVRLLVDGMGCFFTSRTLFKPLIDAGGHVGIFMPPALVRLNYRNHRKLAVIDGSLGYIGGLNIGNEYMGMTKRFGYWRDTHMRVNGSAVRPLTLRFMMDWHFAAQYEFGSRKQRALHHRQIPMTTRYFPSVIEGAARPGSGVRMQIVSSGPDTRYPSVLHGYCKMITEADRSIRIQTPYFVPDESLFGALRVAALSGIDVRIMIPANPDHPFVYWAGLSYLGELLECGVKCYEYEKGFIHSKVLTIDSLVCSVGTANMDVRSFKLNFECNAFIYDEAVTMELEEAFENDLLDCRPIELEAYNQRKKTVKIKESLSRLLSPLL